MKRQEGEDEIESKMGEGGLPPLTEYDKEEKVRIICSLS